MGATSCRKNSSDNGAGDLVFDELALPKERGQELQYTVM